MSYATIDVRKHERKHPKKSNTTIPVRKHQRRICVCGPEELNRTSMMAGKPPTEPTEKLLQKKDGQYVLTGYLPSYWQSDTTSYYRFEKLPVVKARRITTGDPNINPEDGQNSSPPAKEMIEIASKHHGTMEGYVIPVATKRDDARISIDGFTIRATKEEAMKLRKDLKSKKHTEEWGDGKITWTEDPCPHHPALLCLIRSHPGQEAERHSRIQALQHFCSLHGEVVGYPFVVPLVSHFGLGNPETPEAGIESMKF